MNPPLHILFDGGVKKQDDRPIDASYEHEHKNHTFGTQAQMAPEIKGHGATEVCSQ
ncbi:MAG: hypothetical protein ACYCR3_03120 [Acidithiobacillus sp.]